MTARTLVIAPHPDDEVLGCGGTLLRRKREGAEVACLIVTHISIDMGWTAEQIRNREQEITQVANLMGFDRAYNLNLPTTQLDRISLGELVGKFSEVFGDFQPTEVFIPHQGDVHSDHRTVANAAIACTKWFRYPSVKRVLAYETLSETECALESSRAFIPNWYVDITEYMQQKLKIMAMYKSELGTFPFPRSVQAIQALAAYRGTASGFRAAEAFQLLRELQ
jgi:LmbE family N-acetylglucosaminyl deacetylase